MVTNKIFTLVGVLGATLALSGCGKDVLDYSHFRAEVVKLIPLADTQDPSETPKFEVGEDQIFSLRNLDHLSGDFFSMFKGGFLTVKTVEGSLIHSDGFRGGESSEVRYRVKNGVVIPEDMDSLAMLSVYAIYDQLAYRLPSFTGIHMKDVVAQRGVVRLLYHPHIHYDSKAGSIKQGIKKNAAFDPQHFQFLIFPTSQVEGVPMWGNLSVLGHEFGHLIFTHILDQSANGKVDPFLEDAAMRGLDEGFADIVSYVVTGSTNVLGAALPNSSRTVRVRNFSQLGFDYDNRTFVCGSSFYCWGSVFAKAFYQAQVASRADRTTFFRSLVQALIQARAHLDADGDVQKIRASRNSPGNSAVLGIFFRALTATSTDPNIQALRTAVINEFGTGGFPNAYR